MNYRVCLLVIAGLVVCLASGCVKVRSQLIIHQNGSAEVNHMIAMEPTAISYISTLNQDNPDDPIKDISDGFKKSGYTVAGYTEGKMTGVKATKQFKNVADALTALSDPDQQTKGKHFMPGAIGAFADLGKSFKVDKGFFATKYTLNADIDTSTPAENAPSNDRYRAAGNHMMQSLFDFSFVLKLPQKPKSTNAPQISDQGRTMEWPLNLTGKTHLNAEVTVPNTLHIALTIVGLLIALLLCVFLFIGKKTQKLTTVSPTTEEPAKTTGASS